MSDRLRTPFLYAAFVALVIVLLIEIGSSGILKALNDGLDKSSAAIAEVLPSDSDLFEALDENRDDLDRIASKDDAPPGLAIAYLAFVDGLLLFRVGVMVAGTLVPQRIQARVLGFLDCFVSCLGCLGAIGLTLAAVGLLILMVAMFLAVPFGTLAYLALYGFFQRGGASTILTITLVIKIVAAVLLVLAQESFLKNIWLILLLASSLVGNLLISFLHGFVPIFLVSITDAVGAIVMGICAIIWFILLGLGALPAVLKALNLRRL